MNKIKKNPKVSVCVITYNQVNYIRQCLQSILDQETDFDFEVIVGDDCSTDGTSIIIQEFVDKYPNIFIPIFHEKNIGGTQNYFSVHNLTKGAYVAHVDGDDYCYPGKLDYQYKILSSDDTLSICGHDVDRLVNNKVIQDTNKIQHGSLIRFTLVDAINNGPLFAHSSYMYKRAGEFPYNPLANIEIVDYLLLMHTMLSGDAALIKKPLGAYRVHANGISYNNEHKISMLYLDAYLWILKKAPNHGQIILDAAMVNALSIIKHKKFIPKALLKIIYTVKKLPNIKGIIKIRKIRKLYHNHISTCFNLIKS